MKITFLLPFIAVMLVVTVPAKALTECPLSPETCKAAEQGYAWAQYNLGIAYNNGIGVAKDPSEAVRWWRMAAEQGLAQAQYNLGYTYYTGA